VSIEASVGSVLTLRRLIANTDYLLGIAQNKEGVSNAESASLLQVANVGTRKLSFIFRKAVGIQGFSVFARDWYGSDANIPYEWIRPYDRISDYFIQVIAVEGDWTNYSQLATDPFYTDYFSTQGLKPSSINQFLDLPNVNLIGSWVGTIIPDFRDQTGANQYIEDIVNASTQLTGVLLNVNKEALDQLIWDEDSDQWEIGDGSSVDAANWLVDLVGHNLSDIDPSASINKTFLSYDISIAASDFQNRLDIEGIDDKSFVLESSANASLITVGTLVKKSTDNDQIPGVTYVTSKIYDSSNYIFETAEPYYEFGGQVWAQKTIV
jgi:hypothetical protein